MTNESKETSTAIASTASSVLTDEQTGSRSKTAAASALSQHAKPEATTSPEVATAASAVLRDGRTSKASKAAAGSALSQAQGKGPEDEN